MNARRALVTAWLAFWVVPYVARPFGQDHGIFAWVADTISAGGAPYRDAWEVKGPLVYYGVFIVRTLLGHNEWSLRVADAAIMLGGAFVLTRLTRRISVDVRAWIAGTVFFIWFAALNYESSAQPDGWAAVAIASAVLCCFAGDSDGLRSGLAHGALAGLAVLVKPVYALVGLVTLAHAWELRRSDRNALRWFAASLLGGILVLAACATVLAAQGALGAMWDAHVAYSAGVYARSGATFAEKLAAFPYALRRSLSVALALPLAIAGLVIHARTTEHRRSWLTLGAWLLSMLIVVVLQGRYFPYQFLPLCAAMAVLVALALPTLERLARETTHPRWGHCLAIALVLTIVSGSPGFRATRDAAAWWSARVRGSSELALDQDHRYGFFGRGPASMSSLGDYLRHHSGPTDRVQVWGMKAGLYVLADRRPPSRFGLSMPLFLGGDNAFRRRYRAEFDSALAQRPPALIVARVERDCVTRPRSEYECLDSYPELASWVRERYVVDTTIGPYDVYRVRSAGSR